MFFSKISPMIRWLPGAADLFEHLRIMDNIFGKFYGNYCTKTAGIYIYEHHISLATGKATMIHKSRFVCKIKL